MISRYNSPHSCASIAIARDHPKLDSDMIVRITVDLVAKKADIPISLVVETVKKAWGFTISYRKAWRGKQKAVAQVYGSWVASYDKLMGDNSVVQFKRMFWAFKPCINTWWKLEPMLEVDGMFLYGKYKHSLFIVMGQDGNRNIIPIAFALVEGETESAWSWFLWRLREHVTKDREPPLGYNVFCIRHVLSNLNSKFRNRAIMSLLMKAGHEYTHRGFERRLEAICTLNKDASRWIKNIPREKWARAYNGGRRYDYMTTNLAECMNGVLEGVHYLLVTTLVQVTLYKFAEFFNDRRPQVQAQINAGHVFYKDLRDTIFKNLEIARICKVTLRNEDLGEFEVEEPYNQQEQRLGRRCRVYLSQRLCDCRELQQLHLPCIHVLATCVDVTHEFRLYVDLIYKLENMLMAYSQSFHPIEGEEYWPHVPGRPVMHNPQALRPLVGPRTSRICNEMNWKELGNKPKCSLCRVEGHTKKKCLNKKPMQPWIYMS
ncbi:uncharacterized protein G2W53_026308 [Senna tora]|uniref:SWIM-type domain-containing protein n=1 Tax=Senna tora TaxID=362788 RepID=A0A834TEY2_9FABA|nr:uncharacterized protein G2W53_026308 [Senna tora]